MTLQGVFEGAGVAEVHPRHEVREGCWIGDGQIDDGMIRGRRKQSREPRCHACRDRELPARDLGCGLGSGVDQVERGRPTEEGPQESGLCREVVDMELYFFVLYRSERTVCWVDSKEWRTFMSTRASSLFRLGAVRRLPMPDGS